MAPILTCVNVLKLTFLFFGGGYTFWCVLTHMPVSVTTTTVRTHNSPITRRTTLCSCSPVLPSLPALSWAWTCVYTGDKWTRLPRLRTCGLRDPAGQDGDRMSALIEDWVRTANTCPLAVCLPPATWNTGLRRARRHLSHSWRVRWLISDVSHGCRLVRGGPHAGECC